MDYEQQMDGEAIASDSIMNPICDVGLHLDIERIESLSELDDDWDTYGGVPVSARAVAAATNLLLTLDDAREQLAYSIVRPRSIAPLTSGGSEP